jgi:hypothetical protein
LLGGNEEDNENYTGFRQPSIQPGSSLISKKGVINYTITLAILQLTCVPDFKERESDDMNCIILPEDRDQCVALLHTVTNK